MRLALDINKCHFFNPENEQRLVLIEEEDRPVKKQPKKEEVKAE
jgi:hypothetical protein